MQNPFVPGQPLVPPYHVQAMSLMEAYAEKVRAALTRREPAIRDFFDLSPFVLDQVGVDLWTEEFLALVRTKLRVSGNAPVNVSSAKKEVLAKQMNTQLRPVLRASDYSRLDLDIVYERIAQIAEMLT